MDSELHIDTMERGGLISTRQAGRLRESLSALMNYARVDQPRGRSWPVYFAASGVIVVVMLVFIFAGDPQPGLQLEGAEELSPVLYTSARDHVVFNTILYSLLLTSPFLLMMVYYNRLVVRERRIFRRWAQLEKQFLQRALLMPSLIETVATGLEPDHAIEPPLAASAEPATNVQLDSAQSDSALADIGRMVDESTSDLELLARLLAEGERLVDDQGLLNQVSSLDASLKSNLSDFVDFAGKWPSLNGSDQLCQLRASLDRTEYCIAVTRMRFNEAVSAFNGPIQRSPGTLLAGLGNFHQKGFFSAITEPEALGMQAGDGSKGFKGT